ncbi:MAG: flavodoxin family protein [Oscillospiraceae bacterium]|nr:flavodoxin family protein [Oscillospiraceae bacterium]
MKILVLNGSPKRDNSDTMHMTRAFLMGMNDVQENDVHIIDVIDKNIEYCTGCFACMHNGGKCMHQDDMHDILNEILQSDVLIFSFPLYGYGMPAPLKALMDRTLPLGSMAMQKVGDRYEHIAQADFSHLRYVMICGCGFPNSKNNFEGMVKQFELMFPNHHTIITVPESPMFNAPEAAEVTKPFLEVVRQAGREYTNDGNISDDTMRKLNTPMIPEEVYAQIVNGNAQ